MKSKKNYFVSFILTILSILIISNNISAKDVKLFAGAVKNLDINQKSITLKNDKDGESTFIVDEKTIIRSNNINKSINDIKVGDITALLYEEIDGKHIAKSITLIPRMHQNKTSNP